MRVLIHDPELAGLDFAIRCAANGHQVRLWQPTRHPIGEGVEGVKLVATWRDQMGWVGKDGLVFMTGNTKDLRALDRYRDLGFRVFGPTWRSARLEIDRAKGMAAMEGAGIEVPHYETFESLQAAETFARKADVPYVFKTLGSEDDKALSYVASDPADLVGWLQRQCDRGMTLKGPCMLQEKIEMVCEMGVSGWVGPGGFAKDKWQICFEHKKLMAGEVGPNTGEMGTLTQYEDQEKMAADMLMPLQRTLIELGHRGDFAIGCGIDEKGKAWPFEFTVRAGWPAFYLQTASHKGDPVQWMADLIDGKDTLEVDYRPCIGVVMAQPPFPSFDGEASCVDRNPVAGIEEEPGQVHPIMMMRGKGPAMEDGKVKEAKVWQTAGELVLCVTGLGQTVAAARKSCYGVADGIRYPDAIFRTDIGEKLQKPLPKLHAAGYALDLRF